MIQADPKYRVDESSLNNIFVRMSNGEMAPLSQFVTLTRSYGAESLSRFNMFNSIAVNAMPAEGYSTGDAIRAVQETAVQHFPKVLGTTLVVLPVKRPTREVLPLSSLLSVS